MNHEEEIRDLIEEWASAVRAGDEAKRASGAKPPPDPRSAPGERPLDRGSRTPQLRRRLIAMIDSGDGPAVDPASFRRADQTFPGHWRVDPDPWPRPEPLVESAELRGVLEGAIATLPPQLRVVITLRDVEGLDAQEASDLLDLTEADQRALLHRARTKVRTALATYFADAGTDV